MEELRKVCEEKYGAKVEVLNNLPYYYLWYDAENNIVYISTDAKKKHIRVFIDNNITPKRIAV